MSATENLSKAPRAAAGPAVPDEPQGLIDFVLRARTAGIVAVLALLVLVTSVLQPSFIGGSNIRFILSDSTVYVLVAAGEACVMITRNYDISVESIIGLSAYISADMFQTHPGFSIPLAFLVGIGVGVACGAFNGLVTTVGRVPSLVVTLATLYMFRGIDTIIVGSGQVVANSLPNSFINIFHDTLLGIPDIAIGAAILVACGAYYLRSFRSGRDLYAMGSDPEAARLAGIPVNRRLFVAFVLCGACSGLAGVIWVTQFNTIDATAATGLSLPIIAAVVVGGVAVFGGSGSIVGAALGALLLQAFNVSLNVLGIPSIWTEAIAGFLLLAAITLDRGIQLRFATALRKRRAAIRG